MRKLLLCSLFLLPLLARGQDQPQNLTYAQARAEVAAGRHVLLCVDWPYVVTGPSGWIVTHLPLSALPGQGEGLRAGVYHCYRQGEKEFWVRVPDPAEPRVAAAEAPPQPTAPRPSPVPALCVT